METPKYIIYLPYCDQLTHVDTDMQLEDYLKDGGDPYYEESEAEHTIVFKRTKKGDYKRIVWSIETSVKIDGKKI